MRRLFEFVAPLVMVGSVVMAALAWPINAESGSVAHGRYLAAIMDCTGCHTPGALAGKPDMERALAGSHIGFKLPGLGVFYPPNLTPDDETGLGRWSEEEITTAVRKGVRPDGRVLAPVMPYHSYAALTDGDAKALAVYLKSLKPQRNAVPGPVGDSETPTAPYLTVVVPEAAAAGRK